MPRQKDTVDIVVVEENTVNIVVVGESKSGKTQLISQLTKGAGTFSAAGVTFNLRESDEGFDEGFQESDIIISIVEDQRSFDEEKAVRQVDQQRSYLCPQHLPCIMVVNNNTDQERFTQENINSYQKQISATHICKVSTQTGKGVDDLRNLLVAQADRCLRENAAQYVISQFNRGRDYSTIHRLIIEDDLETPSGDYALEAKDSPHASLPLVDDNTAHKLDFETYFDEAQERVLADLANRKISIEAARAFANASAWLANAVNNDYVTIGDIVKYHNDVQPYLAESPSLARTIGRIIGVALGLALGILVGAMIGAGLGPGAALTALGCGAAGASIGAGIGAAAGAALGTAIMSYFGGRFGIWNHPLSRMERVAKKLIMPQLQRCAGEVDEELVDLLSAPNPL